MTKPPILASDALCSRTGGMAGVALSSALNSPNSDYFQVSISEGGEIENTETAPIWKQPFQLADGALF